MNPTLHSWMTTHQYVDVLRNQLEFDSMASGDKDSKAVDGVEGHRWNLIPLLPLPLILLPLHSLVLSRCSATLAVHGKQLGFFQSISYLYLMVAPCLSRACHGKPIVSHSKRKSVLRQDHFDSHLFLSCGSAELRWLTTRS